MFIILTTEGLSGRDKYFFEYLHQNALPPFGLELPFLAPELYDQLAINPPVTFHLPMPV